MITALLWIVATPWVWVPLILVALAWAWQHIRSLFYRGNHS